MRVETVDRLRSVIRRNWTLITVAAGLYLFGVVVGGMAIVGTGGELTHAAQFGGEDQPEPRVTVGGILERNTVVNVLTVVGGVFLGVPSLFILVFNGFITGITFFVSSAPLLERVALFVPHAIPEYSAYCLSGAVALRFPCNVIQHLRNRRADIFDRREFVDAAILAALSFTLLAFAAIVESLVTPHVASVV